MVIRLPELRVTRHGVAVYVVLYPLLEGSLDGSGEGALVVGDVVVVEDEVVQTGGIVDLRQPPADPQHDGLCLEITLRTH